MLKELQSLGLDVVVQDKDGNEIDMRQNFDDEETGFDMRDPALSTRAGERTAQRL